MNEKIRNAYEKMSVLSVLTGDKKFHLAIDFDGSGRITTSVDCSKYAKFLINDFKSLENKFGKDIYTKVDPNKLKGLFAIQEEYFWFNRKELTDFIESLMY
jgi:hypothetical protein